MTKPYLISKSQLEDLKRMNALGRRTGKSTAFALSCISWMITNPNKPIEILDHYDTRESNRLQLRRIAEMVRDLGLHGFEFNFADNIAKFNLYEE